MIENLNKKLYFFAIYLLIYIILILLLVVLFGATLNAYLMYLIINIPLKLMFGKYAVNNNLITDETSTSFEINSENISWLLLGIFIRTYIFVLYDIFVLYSILFATGYVLLFRLIKYFQYKYYMKNK